MNGEGREVLRSSKHSRLSRLGEGAGHETLTDALLECSSYIRVRRSLIKPLQTDWTDLY